MPMCVIVTRDVPPRFRGFLGSCMLEIAPGVYTQPDMSASVRKRAWSVLSDWWAYYGRGSVVMTWAAPNTRSVREYWCWENQARTSPSTTDYSSSGESCRADAPGSLPVFAFVWSFPRTCGDGPLLELCRLCRPAFPPHVRGWTLAMHRIDDHHIVSPARAGMDRRTPPMLTRPSCFPRTCGDGPVTDPSPLAVQVFPRTCGDGPATRAPRSPVWNVSPRTCGDGPSRSSLSGESGKFPPHVRGWTVNRERRAWARHVPPHVRGWTVLRATRSVRWGVSPARAGMDP